MKNHPQAAVRAPSVSGGTKLSVCIPTYNRAAFIGATLESISSQIEDGIEVVIVDGASTDNTSEVVASFEDRLPRLTYHRGVKNMGVDRDMATAVEIARGEYCWLMSSDDVFAPGALSTMLGAVRSSDDIYLCDIALCDFHLKPIRNTVCLSPRRAGNRFNLSDRAQLLQYLRFATSNNAVFCYMSSMGFRRSKWINAGYNERFGGTGYAHVFTLLSFIRLGCVLTYLPSPLVLNRADNDSFSAQGIEKRYMMDFDGFLMLGDTLFKDDPEVRRAFLHLMTREHPWYRIAKFRSAVASPSRWNEIHAKLVAFGYGRWTLALGDLLGRLSFFVALGLYLNKRLARSALLRWLRKPT